MKKVFAAVSDLLHRRNIFLDERAMSCRGARKGRDEVIALLPTGEYDFINIREMGVSPKWNYRAYFLHEKCLDPKDMRLKSIKTIFAKPYNTFKIDYGEVNERNGELWPVMGFEGRICSQFGYLTARYYDHPNEVVPHTVKPASKSDMEKILGYFASVRRNNPTITRGGWQTKL